MRLAHVALMMALGAAFCSPAMAQTALPGAAVANKPVAPSTAPAAGTMAPGTMAPGMAMSAPVNINTATAAQLDALPQIGPKRAAAIIKNRPYTTVDDLVTKKAISAGILKKIKARITV